MNNLDVFLAFMSSRLCNNDWGDLIAQNMRSLSVSKIARCVGISRSFFYQNVEARRQIRLFESQLESSGVLECKKIGQSVKPHISPSELAELALKLEELEESISTFASELDTFHSRAAIYKLPSKA
ncbi:hypothetical protein DY931_32635 [Pseudomonas aeruginosa]|uniref:DUF6262 family protein n=1 Tax=Pseudomonas aeruginosa TaxID=287 RepID=UPI000F816C06|nr:DUF6262 family protein [Pseudomonas aeruginosa]RTR53925.1 hypothetical protein DY931_32635 [Pseudomonas aeruginosa]